MKSKYKKSPYNIFQFFKNVLDAMADLVYIVNKDREIQYINPAMKKVFGSKDGKKCYEYLSDLSMTCPWCSHENVLDGHTIRREWYCQKKDRIYDVIETPLHNENGQVFKLKIMRDITDLKRWEQKLQNERDLLKNIMENTHSMMAYLDKDFNFIHVNTAYAEGSGYSVKELIGRNHFDLFPNQENYAIFKKVRDTGNSIGLKDKPFTFAHQPERGVTYWNWTLNPITNSAGDTENLVLTLEETTKRKRIENKLKESEARYKLAQKAAHIGTWDWDIKTGKLVWSEEVETLFGLQTGEFKNDYKEFVKLIHPEDREKVQSAIDRCIEVKEDYDVEHRIIWPDGSIHWLREMGNVICDEKQLAVRMLGIVQDITEQKEAREILENTREQLERGVKKRTEELEKLNTILQQEIAERKNYQEQLHSLMSRMTKMEEQARRRIATGLHDRIVQSLALTKIKLEKIIDNNEDIKLKDTLEEIHQLVDQNINETRSLTFEISPPILYEMGLVSAIEWLADKMSKKHDLDITVKNDGEFTSMDDNIRNILFQTVQELLNNIQEHAGASQAEIQIAEEEDNIVIQIKDNGVGFKVSEVKPDMSRLTGFGLFNIKERLKYVKGQCRITSGKNQGTTVVIKAPWKKNN
ncbi:MAG: PAS domain S-box protein [bacterium]